MDVKRLVLAIGLIVHTSAAHADQFRLLKGGGVPVCEAYKRYLDSVTDPLGHESARPDEQLLLCWRKIPPKFRGFSQPKWRKINPSEHIDLAVDVSQRISYVWDERNPPRWLGETAEGFRSAIRLNYENGHDAWYSADADVENDGRSLPLAKYQRGRCNDYEPDVRRYGIQIMVLGRAGEHVDAARTRQILRKGPTQPLGVAGSFDIFRYQGLTYVDHWENEREYRGRSIKDRRLSVYLNRGGRSTLVCRYRYTGSTN